MAIDFTLTEKQQEIQESAREFARNHLAPITDRVDAEPDPLKAFQLMKDAYAEACKRGFAFSMLPAEYGGGGLSNVDFVLAAEEIQAIDPGFGTTAAGERTRADAGLVLRNRGTEEEIHRHRHGRPER